MKEYFSFAHTSIGFSHISSKKPCQDYSMHYQNDDASVIIVSDGHGSSNFIRSDRGSRFACEVTSEAVNEFLQDVNLDNLSNEFLRDSIITQLCKNIILRWNLKVDEDAIRDPFTDDEVVKVSDTYKQRYLNGESVEHAYGCTLIVVIITKDFCLAIRNGDGECVSVDRDGRFEKPIPWNENCEFNVVTSMCDQKAIEDFRYYYSTDLPAAIFIGSDGVDDSYTSADELFNLYRLVCLKVLNDGFMAGANYVETALPEISRRGSTDDVSIAALINPHILEEARTAMEIAIELRQIQIAEARKEQQKRIIIRDIKVAEKKRAKAIEQRRDVLKNLHSERGGNVRLSDQIPFLRKQPSDCNDNPVSLVQIEKQLTEIINESDREIVRLKGELLALTEQAESSGIPDSMATISIDPVDEAITEVDDLLDRSEEVSVRFEADNISDEQTVEPVFTPQDDAAEPAEAKITSSE